MVAHDVFVFNPRHSTQTPICRRFHQAEWNFHELEKVNAGDLKLVVTIVSEVDRHFGNVPGFDANNQEWGRYSSSEVVAESVRRRRHMMPTDPWRIFRRHRRCCRAGGC